MLVRRTAWVLLHLISVLRQGRPAAADNPNPVIRPARASDGRTDFTLLVRDVTSDLNEELATSLPVAAELIWVRAVQHIWACTWKTLSYVVYYLSRSGLYCVGSASRALLVWDAAIYTSALKLTYFGHLFFSKAEVHGI